ncbi:MAG: SdpI family protein [Ruminococcus sp.]|nr:SdpI family protein [Ruminococcus sp.]
MKKFSLLILSLINAAVNAVLIAVSPRQLVPTHWGIEGYADGFSSKWLLMMLPAIPFIIGLGWLLFELFMRKSYSARENDKVAFKIVAGIFALFLALDWFFLFASLNDARDLGDKVSFLSLMFMGILLIYTGNLMPKVKQNGVLGIRTYSTLSDEAVWRKTHRFAGYLGVACGGIIILMGIICFFVKISPLVCVLLGAGIALVGFAITPSIYASVIYRKIKANKP